MSNKMTTTYPNEIDPYNTLTAQNSLDYMNTYKQLSYISIKLYRNIIYDKTNITNIWAHFRCLTAKDLSTVPKHIIEKQQEYLKNPDPKTFDTLKPIFEELINNADNTTFAIGFTCKNKNSKTVAMMKHNGIYCLMNYDNNLDITDNKVENEDSLIVFFRQ